MDDSGKKEGASKRKEAKKLESTGGSEKHEKIYIRKQPFL